MGGLWRDTNVYRENEALSYIFMWNILRHFIVLYLNILWLKTVDEITARQTWTSLCKHDITILCSVEYLTTQIELVLPTFFKSWTVHKVIEYLTLGLLSSLWNICHINVSLNRPPDHTWRHPRNKWLDQLWKDSTRPIGDLWRHAVDRGHGGATTRRPWPAMRPWWWGGWGLDCGWLNIKVVCRPIVYHHPSNNVV